MKLLNEKNNIIQLQCFSLNMAERLKTELEKLGYTPIIREVFFTAPFSKSYILCYEDYNKSKKGD